MEISGGQMTNKDNHINVGGLVLCKKCLANKSSVWRWLREDSVYQSRMSKVLTWVKEKIFFIPQWKPVDKDEIENITDMEF